MTQEVPQQTLRYDMYAYCQKKYHVSPVYPWEKLPFYAVFRHGSSGKWFGLVMNLPGEKLNRPGTKEHFSEKEAVDTLTVRCDPRLTLFLQQERGVLPAYHLNQKNWVTVLLDGTVPLERIRQLLDESFLLTEEPGDRKLQAEVRFTGEYAEERIPGGGASSEERIRGEGMTAAPRRAGRQPAGAAPLPEKLRELKDMGNPFDYNAGASAHIFYRQGVFAADYEDEFRFHGTVRRYYPTYSALTNDELRGYFGWRTRFRRGEAEREASVSFVYLYIYELLCGIGVTPEEGLERLLEIDRTYGKREVSMHRSLALWIPDYLVYYGLDPAMAPGYVPETGDGNVKTFTDFLAAVPEYDPEAGSPVRIPEELEAQVPEMFRAVCALSPYDLAGAPYVKKCPAEAAQLCALVLAGLEGELKLERRGSLADMCFGRKDIRTYRMFRSAVFYDHRQYKEYDFALTPDRVFRCRDGIWMLETRREHDQRQRILGNLCREIDRQTRREFRAGRELKKPGVDEVIEARIAEMVRGYREELEKKAALKKVQIDMSLLSRIRRDAAETREALIVEEEPETREALTAVEEPEAAVPVMTEEEPEAAEILDVRESAAAVEEREPAGAAELPEPAADGMFTREEALLLHALLTGQSLRDALGGKHQPLSMLVDNINEKMMDEIGDTVIEFEGDDPVIIEDYREELREIDERQQRT